MSSQSQPAPDAVLRHGAGLRALARAVLAREHEADDAVQETWLRYLEARPQESEGLASWLATVLRRWVSNERRSVERRTQRERAVARDELDEPECAREREERFREVMRAVLALDEPYRGVVLMRWFEGLSPRSFVSSD